MFKIYKKKGVRHILQLTLFLYQCKILEQALLIVYYHIVTRLGNILSYMMKSKIGMSSTSCLTAIKEYEIRSCKMVLKTTGKHLFLVYKNFK
jgi:hypothetical protein